jgi:hypothetical protein
MLQVNRRRDHDDSLAAVQPNGRLAPNRCWEGSRSRTTLRDRDRRRIRRQSARIATGHRACT